MRYLKTYEYYIDDHEAEIEKFDKLSDEEKRKYQIENTLYNIGEYVRVSLMSYDPIDDNEVIPNSSSVAKIIDYSTNYSYPYILLLPHGGTFWTSEVDFLEEPTPEEIEKFEIDVQSNKYNL